MKSTINLQTELFFFHNYGKRKIFYFLVRPFSTNWWRLGVISNWPNGAPEMWMGPFGRCGAGERQPGPGRSLSMAPSDSALRDVSNLDGDTKVFQNVFRSPEWGVGGGGLRGKEKAFLFCFYSLFCH